ncbi:hypothetical protein M413DRAFT_178434 [Hebeloma cylindrosporum]|uniref:Uncharacterized protein n=1 Tax=Hebeloma cylindrosporum TaxID=76867 RepID=A0A0C3BUM5_HEBCY|nr:hypothetical protein M413DRAFT_178434 [Hebeloma cylindrosporum h7]
MSARVVYQDIPVLGDSSTTNITEEGRKILFHALAMRALELDFLNSPLQTLADVAASGQGMNDAYRFALGEKEKENIPVAVPITAPVPLSYAVRGKSALRSILAMGEEEEVGVLWDDPPAVRDSEQEIYAAIYNSRFEVQKTVQGNEHQVYAPISNTRFQDAAFQPIPGPGIEVQPNNQGFWNPGCPRPPMIIRPITPSTLMALTEPCLMAWCSKSALDKRFPSASVSGADYDGARAVDYMPSSAQNTWGY